MKTIASRKSTLHAVSGHKGCLTFVVTSTIGKNFRRSPTKAGSSMKHYVRLSVSKPSGGCQKASSFYLVSSECPLSVRHHAIMSSVNPSSRLWGMGAAWARHGHGMGTAWARHDRQNVLTYINNMLTHINTICLHISEKSRTFVLY